LCIGRSGETDQTTWDMIDGMHTYIDVYFDVPRLQHDMVQSHASDIG
jgi:hypothetical protein